MSIQKHLQSENLLRYSLAWSQARLIIAGVALFLGGVPPALLLFPFPIIGSLLTMSWIISGIASGYMLYRWLKGGKKLFEKKDSLDTAAFFVSVISGLNLGIAGIFGVNIGLTVSSGKLILLVTAMIYFATYYHLFRRWKTVKESIL